MLTIIKEHNSPDELHFIVDKDNFQEMNVSDIYVNGQKMDAGYAGDYLSVSKDFTYINAEGNEREVKEGEIIAAFNDQRYDEIWFLTSGNESENVSFHYEKCIGYTYWTGNHYHTITISIENGEPTHVLCEEDVVSKILSEYKKAKDTEPVFGKNRKESENYIFLEPMYSTFFEAEIQNNSI